MIPWLDSPTAFPDTKLALREPNGLICAGGNLDPATIVNAYSRGIFPWFSDDQPILWWSPDPRMVLFPGEFKVSKSLAKTVRSGKYTVRFDIAFDDVIKGCAAPREPGGGTWIVPEMQEAYGRLHKLGVAHSVESWVAGEDGEELMGGLYGIALGRMFYGESMFARATDASKVALVALVEKLKRDGFQLIDCQQETRHLARFGARPIPRADFVQRLKELINWDQVSPPTSHWSTEHVEA
ncbi:MAG: leucyl/phenylalanyl-tRNA--protein transferase [Betaproteobacteria bacterium]|nr:leucyl/phenylalanyl-tRNA--protein transferase [Betaproteobacteria bacterium]